MAQCGSLNRIIDGEELVSLLRDLEEQGALEFRMRGDTGYVPYMMNDAVEDYLQFDGCTLTGEAEVCGGIASAACVSDGDRKGLVFRSAEDHICSVWYDTCTRKMQCYAYHGILHCWVTEEEHWRRLVYMIGTANDKAKYHPGIDICSAGEKELVTLMGFAPFVYWSPVNMRIDPYYPSTPEGAACMKKLAREAGDRRFERLVAWYRRFPKLLKRCTADRLRQSWRIYELLAKRTAEASAEYPERVYPEEMTHQIRQAREKTAGSLLQAGYTGTWPRFRRDSEQVTVLEELPFTVPELDYDDFVYTQHLLVRTQTQHGPVWCVRQIPDC